MSKQDFIQWIMVHWPELAAAAGIGAGSGIAGKKITDKNQDSAIKQLQEKIEKAASKEDYTELKKDVDELGKEFFDYKLKLIELKGAIETNNKLDEQLRAELKEHRDNLNERLGQIEEMQKDILKAVMGSSGN